MDAVEGFNEAAKWANDNQGVLTVILFVMTVTFGWVSGIFSALRRKPKFKITLIPGPSFCCTFLTGKKDGRYDVHRTGIALYLRVSNIGSAPSSIENVSVAYHWDILPGGVRWLRYSIGWFWLHEQVIALQDFQAPIGDDIKVYPFLTQHSFLAGGSANTFLEVGQAANGVVYFEQPDSWGGCFPRCRNGVTRMKIAVRDVFGTRHIAAFDVPVVTIQEARVYNPSFGKTFAELRGEVLPHDTGRASQAELSHTL